MHGSKCKGGRYDCSQEEKRWPPLLHDIKDAGRRQEWNLIPLLNSMELSPLLISVIGRGSYVEYVSIC
jgi:hypothetical protein